MPEIIIKELNKTVTIECKKLTVFKFTTFITHELDTPLDLCVWISYDLKGEWKDRFECDKKAWIINGKCVINPKKITIHGLLYIKLTSKKDKIHSPVKIIYEVTKNNP